MNFLINLILTVFLTTSLVYPTAIDLLFLKAVLTVFIIILILFREISRLGSNKNDRRSALVWLLALLSFGAFFSAVGAASAGPGVLKMMQVYILWPIVYYYIFTRINEAGLTRALSISVYASVYLIFIFCSSLILIALFLGIDNYQSFAEVISFGSTVGVADFSSIFGFTFPGLMSMPFLFGYLSWDVFYVKARSTGPSFKKVAWLMALVVCLFSGRNALLVVSAAAILITIYLLPRDSRDVLLRNLIRYIIYSAIIVIFYLALSDSTYSFGEIYKLLSENFTSSANQTRANQAQLLLDGFISSPITGVGLGVPHPSVFRSATSPWSYEMVYHAMLYQTGVIGTMIYIFLMLVPPLSCFLICRKNRLLVARHDGCTYVPIGIGFFCVLIADSTNPYLARFDAIWMAILLPVLLSRYWYINSPFVTRDPR
jgi:hypothetical protein